MSTHPTPAEEFAAFIRGHHAGQPEAQPEPATPTRRAPRPDPSQASGANGRAPVDPAATFAAAIANALQNPHTGRP